MVLEFRKVEKRSGKDELHVYSDSDWAGCLRTRKSTSGGIATLNGAAVKTWSSTQATLATSSGEAEFYAAARAAAEGLGIKAIMEDMGYEVDVIVHVDSTSAKSISSRAGLGKVRHMEVRLLWIQEAVRNKRIQMWKIKGENNPADILTKPMSLREMRSNEKLDKVNFTQPEKAMDKKSWADMTEEEFGER
jgi:hypothetical protein